VGGHPLEQQGAFARVLCERGRAFEFGLGLLVPAEPREQVSAHGRQQVVAAQGGLGGEVVRELQAALGPNAIAIATSIQSQRERSWSSSRTLKIRYARRPVGLGSCAVLLLDALTSGRWRAVWLAVQPGVLLAPLVAAVLAIGVVPSEAQPALRLTVVAVWAWCCVSVLPRRAARVSHWLRTRVGELGGELDPVQPVTPMGTLELNIRNAGWRLDSLESERLSFMRGPGIGSRRVLSLVGLLLTAPVVTHAMFVEERGLAFDALSALAIALVAVALTDLFRGRHRIWRRPWRTCDGPWPAAWTIADSPSRVLGPIWFGLFALLGVATLPISQADSLGTGISRACFLVFPIVAVWELRERAARLAALERTRCHRVVARVLVALAPFAWDVVLAVQGVLGFLGVALFALSPINATAAYPGLVMMWLAMWVHMLRGDWRRPEDPVLVDAHQVQALCLEEHVEKRVTVSLRILVALAGVWLYLHEIGALAGA
jgi:hypothetical protein